MSIRENRTLINQVSFFQKEKKNIFRFIDIEIGTDFVLRRCQKFIEHNWKRKFIDIEIGTVFVLRRCQKFIEHNWKRKFIDIEIGTNFVLRRCQKFIEHNWKRKLIDIEIRTDFVVRNSWNTTGNGRSVGEMKKWVVKFSFSQYCYACGLLEEEEEVTNFTVRNQNQPVSTTTEGMTQQHWPSTTTRFSRFSG